MDHLDENPEHMTFRFLHAAILTTRWIRNRLTDLIFVMVVVWLLDLFNVGLGISWKVVVALVLLEILFEGVFHVCVERFEQHEITRFALVHSHRRRFLRRMIRALHKEADKHHAALWYAKAAPIRFIAASLLATLALVLIPGWWGVGVFLLVLLLGVISMMAAVIRSLRVRWRYAELVQRTRTRFFAA